MTPNPKATPMTPILRDRCTNMILGALVADAAAMGLHWIYDQKHIRSIAPETPEFRCPDPHHYEGVPAYFAHPTRKAGDASQYGEQLLVMLRTIAASGGQFEVAAFAEAFRAHFGYGGAYVGYIDHATRGTLDNARRFEDAALACAQTLPFDGDPKITKALVAQALPLIARHAGAPLAGAFDIRLSQSYEQPAVRDHGRAVLAALTALPRPAGAVDMQLPAIAKLPPLVAHLALRGITEGALFEDPVLEAVRATSDHPEAAIYGEISAQMMAGAVQQGTVVGAIAAARAVAPPDAAHLLDDALAMEERETADVTRHFGMACDLAFGVPSATHNISTAPGFTQAVRRNIYAGGDSCGRAILVGAVAGAVHGIGGANGIPKDWIDQLAVRDEVMDLCAVLVNQA